MTEIFSKIGVWLAAALGAIALIVGAFLRGKSSGRTEEKQEREIIISQQNTEAKEIVKEVQNEQAKMSIDAVRERAADKWLRK